MARRNRFPTFGVILFVIAFLWLLSDLKFLKIDIPWIPVILLIVASGMIYNRMVAR